MKTPFVIFCRALGIYALLTLPALTSPIIYFISILYVISFGWFAWALFTIISFISITASSPYWTRICFLIMGVPVSVAFSFQMIEVFEAERNVWHSGVFLAFPMAATVSGWISLYYSEKEYRKAEPEEVHIITENTTP